MAPRLQTRTIVVSDLVVEERHRGEAPVIAGHAAVFSQVADLGYMREEIAPGAFTRALHEKQEVTALWNHDPNFVLASTKNGSLRLSEDKIGLYAEMTPMDTQTIRDLVVKPIQAGLVNKMSFGFIPQKEDIRQDKLGAIRVVRDVNLFDVSPVTFPAYAGTDISARMASLYRRIKRAMPAGQATELIDVLMEAFADEDDNESRDQKPVQVEELMEVVSAGVLSADARQRRIALFEPIVKGTIHV